MPNKNLTKEQYLKAMQSDTDGNRLEDLVTGDVSSNEEFYFQGNYGCSWLDICRFLEDSDEDLQEEIAAWMAEAGINKVIGTFVEDYDDEYDFSGEGLHGYQLLNYIAERFCIEG